MAGHSQFKNIMYRKGAQDAKRAKVFTKVTREITVAVKEAGSDPASNARLRSAILAARDVNMPKDNIDRAIKKALGGDESLDYVEMRYEGYGPGGVAVIVEALTENRNRTAADVRSAFNKFGGSLGETNSVSFQFDRLGILSYDAKVASADGMFEAVIEAGGDDVESDAHSHVIRTSLEAFHSVREHLAQRFGEPNSGKISWEPQNLVPISEETARTLLKLIDVLEDNDDIQTVASNFDLDDDTLAKLERGA